MKDDLFSHKKGFFELPIVRWTGFLIATSASLIAVIITVNGNYQNCGSAECFNFFIQQYKLPLGVLTLAIPIAALYAAQHRSILTIAQIAEAKKQNDFVNYYKHLEEFKTHINQMNFQNDINNYRSTHNILFSAATEGNYQISDNTQKVIILKLSNLYKIFKELEEFSFKKFNNDIEKKQLYIYFLLLLVPILLGIIFAVSKLSINKSELPNVAIIFLVITMINALIAFILTT